MEVLNYINEVWKPVRGYFNLYEVSNFGRVRSLGNGKTYKTGRVLSPFKAHNGYLRVELWKDEKRKTYRLHRLVWEAFNGPIPKGMQVNHINEDKTDNRLANLNLMTCKENINYGTGIQRAAKSRRKMVEQYTLDGVHFMTWFSVKGVEEELGYLGYSASAISACCNGKLKSHKGYIWKHEEPIENK